MGDAYAGPRDGVFSRPYEPRLLGLPREQQQSMRRLSGEAGTAAARLRVKQELDLVPERVKMEPDESLEYYYSASGVPHYSASGMHHYPRPRSAESPPSSRRQSLSYPRPPDDGFAAYTSVAAFRDADGAGGISSSRCDPPPPPPLESQQRFHHRVDLTLHLKQEAQEEADKGGDGAGGGGGPGGGGSVPPAQDDDPEEEEYRDRSEMGSSRTVIGGSSSIRGTRRLLACLLLYGSVRGVKLPEFWDISDFSFYGFFICHLYSLLFLAFSLIIKAFNIWYYRFVNYAQLLHGIQTCAVLILTFNFCDRVEYNFFDHVEYNFCDHVEYNFCDNVEYNFCDHVEYNFCDRVEYNFCDRVEFTDLFFGHMGSDQHGEVFEHHIK